MEIDSGRTPENAPTSRTRTWIRRMVIAAACAPLSVITVLHTMGRSGDFGVLGRWYVVLPLTLLGVFAWALVEKAAGWSAEEPGGR
ncbi:hypothetical protein Acy02nite_70390 [Actinoplanes cyaneus]|uniref:Uncharacterized protein n=1 Tax=Actinoplanes cyaneus TaxID=52696 RepID=A0A919M975_9ACTN|nr:hypothetical protein [Actinoplanes cyaneus]MCW2140905.1 hypothetical protein [Actinoplanes cyaneus]GID69158.1 hypothetical protein Acy02nite_70390 [Actinoplanes cyaneus]